jgi:Mce-associated membrane protein
MTSGTTPRPSGPRPRRPSGVVAQPARPATPTRSKRAAAEPAVRPGRKLPTQRPAPVVSQDPSTRRFPVRFTLRLPVRWQLVNVVLGVLLVAAIVLGSVALSRWQDQRQLEGVRQEALAAAKQAAVNFVSISESTVDTDMQRIIDGATGDFKDQYVSNRATFKDQVVSNKASSTGTVLRAAILSNDSDSAVVLVALDATVKNTGTPDGRLSHYRMQLSMARDAGTGKWLVAQLDFVG